MKIELCVCVYVCLMCVYIYCSVLTTFITKAFDMNGLVKSSTRKALIKKLPNFV